MGCCVYTTTKPWRLTVSLALIIPLTILGYAVAVACFWYGMCIQ